MKILFLEMRRYLRPLTLTVMGILMLFWVFLFHSGFERPSYRHWGLLSVEYQQRFGDTIDREELEIIKQELDDLHAELDGLIEQYMGEYDVHSFEDYFLLSQLDYFRATDEAKAQEAETRWGTDNLEELERTCHDIYWYGPMEELAWREQGIRSWIEDFEWFYNNEEYMEAVRTNDPEWGFHLNDYQKQRILSDIQCGERSVSINAHISFRDYFHDYTVLIYILCALMVVPFLVTNRITGVQAMQISSKSGKSLLKKQLGAALAITAAVNVMVDVFFYIACFYNEDEAHYLLNAPLNVGAGRNQLWLNLTYGQYVYLTFAKVLLLSLTLTAGLFIVSYFSKNYIVAMTVAVPSVIAVSLLSERLDCHVYLDNNAVWEYPVMLLLPMAAVIAFAMVTMHRIRTSDYID